MRQQKRGNGLSEEERGVLLYFTKARRVTAVDIQRWPEQLVNKFRPQLVRFMEACTAFSDAGRAYQYSPRDREVCAGGVVTRIREPVLQNFQTAEMQFQTAYKELLVALRENLPGVMKRSLAPQMQDPIGVNPEEVHVRPQHILAKIDEVRGRT